MAFPVAGTNSLSMKSPVDTARGQLIIPDSMVEKLVYTLNGVVIEAFQ